MTKWLGVGRNITKRSEWQSGRRDTTVGIWMWSEIFTHDFENGDKVAIILLDGTLDDQLNLTACCSLFALSLMLSSVQCYDIKRHIQQDHLEHLKLCTEYGRIAAERSEHFNGKPFQKLILLVRDWPGASKIIYGYNDRMAIDDIFAEINNKTSDMQQVRSRIEANFDKIGAFLMPTRGMFAPLGFEFTFDLQNIDPEIIKYLNELVIVLFAPENLIAKRINGQRVQACEFFEYLRTYADIFNDDRFFEVDTVFKVIGN